MEQQTCPSRMQQLGPWKREERLDKWERNRWTKDHTEAEAGRREWREKNPNGSISDTADEWCFDSEVPRTCSFCGSVHPEDAIELIGRGWEIEYAKVYKRYLRPPGSMQATQTMINSMKRGDIDIIRPSVWSPVPPVKLYLWHFESQDQCDRLNTLLGNKS